MKLSYYRGLQRKNEYNVLYIDCVDLSLLYLFVSYFSADYQYEWSYRELGNE